MGQFLTADGVAVMKKNDASRRREAKVKSKALIKLARSYTVKINRLVLDMSIGVHPHEKLNKQRVALDLELEVEYPIDGFERAIYKKVACYETLIGEVKKLALSGHIVLVETFAEKIADIALSDQRVIAASVSVEKLDIFDDCEAVGARIRKSRIN